MKTPTLHHRKISNTNAMPPKIRVGGMQRQTKATQVKKVAPPTVPDSPSNRKSSGSCSSGYSSGSCSSANLECTSFSNVGTNDNYPSSPCINRPNIKDSIHQGSLLADNGNVGESSLSSSHPYTAFHYPPQQPYTHIGVGSRSIGSQPGSPMHQEPSVLIQEHTTVYDRFPPSFQAQISLEDQGIDLQSPGRDSPGSSGSSGSGSGLGGSGCRNSTSSLDSGRASSSAYDGKTGHTYIQTQHRLSSHSYESTGSLRHSYHSSSSSLGSMEEPQVVQINVHDLLAAGYPDQDILNRWLNDLHFEEYYHLFVQAGYDMPTISRMTPEDLTAVGITKPGHRKKLKAEIARLNISDGLPLYIPNSITEWLHLLHLEEYEETLHQQGYHTVEQVTDIAWEDLEEIGIKKLGHQKKMMLAIKRVKDILSGVRRFSVDQHDQQQVKLMKDNIPTYNYPLQEVAITTTKAVTSPFPTECYNQPELRTFQQTQYMSQTPEAFHCDNLNSAQHMHGIPPERTINSPLHSYRTMGHVKGTSSPSHMLYRPDMVAVHIRHPSGARSLENLESNRDAVKANTIINANEHRYYDGMLTWRRGSVDDGEVTPTNETMIMCEMEGGGTLPRPKVSVKPRPVAKIIAKSRRVITDATVDSQYVDQNYECNPSPEKDKYPEIISYGSPRKDVGSLYGTIGRTKKTPPPPPKRTNSIKSEKSSEKIIEKTVEDNPEQVFANCIKSLATKFSISQDENISSSPSKGTIEVTSDVVEFSPMTESVLQQVENVSCTVHKSPHEPSELISETTLQHSDSDPELPLHPKRNDSNSSFDSSSSTDSNSLPFANENVGTIKQRAIKQHPPLSVMEMPRSQRSSPVIPSRIGHPVSSQSSTVAEHQYEMRSSEIDDDYDDVAEDESVLDEIRRLGRPQDTGDVLNDIGNMLADLTDELDAMLESELQPPQ